LRAGRCNAAGNEFLRLTVSSAQKGLVPMLLHKADTHEMPERQCPVKGLSVKALQAGSRDRVYSSIRRELAGKFVLEMGRGLGDVHPYVKKLL